MSMFNGPGKIAFGFGLGIIAASAVKEVLPAFRGLGKPLLKASVKSGLILAREGRVKLAEMREMLADASAEAQAELDQEMAKMAVEEDVDSDGTLQSAGIM